MSEEIVNAEKYLTARLAECSNRPDLHRHTVEVYGNYLKTVSERPQDYVKEAGDMFAVMQAEQLDRNENYIALYKKFSQEERVEAYTLRAEAVKESNGYGDFYTKNNQAQKETEHLIGLEHKKRELLSNTMRGIIAWRVAIDSDRKAYKDKVTDSWNSLKKTDPDLNWRKIRTFPPYRNCLYYNDRQLDMLEKWFTEING